jgi:PST family polysaccharide transporter
MDVVARGVSWKVLSVVFGQGSWYASLLVLAVLVPPRDFGVMAVGSAVVSGTLLILESGTGGSLIIARELTPASVRRSLILTSVAGLAATALFIALARPVADVFTGGADAGVLRVMAVTVGLAAVSIVPNALLSKHLRFKAIAQIWIAAAAIASVAAVVAAALHAGVWALVIRIVVNQVVLTALTVLAARRLLPRARSAGEPAARRAGATSFLLIASATFLAWTCDNLAVGAFTTTTELGLYALAFSLAYLPLTQVSWTVGQVLLPAIAAARDEEVVRRQTLKALRMMALLLVPLLPAAIAVAPGLIPAAFGARWTGMVVPYQILVVVGVGYGVLNILGEALAGAGVRSVRVRARIDVTWAVATIGAIVIGVNLDGIRGAALAHLVTFCGLAIAYGWRGGRGIGLSLRAVLGAVRSVALCAALQAAVTAAVTLGVERAGSGLLAGGLLGAAAGLLVLAVALRACAGELLAEGRAVLTATLRRRAA